MNIDVKSLKACLKIAPTEEVRRCLNGVYIECGGGRIQYTATNGAALFTVWEKASSDWQGSIIIPVEAARLAVKTSASRIPLQPPKLDGASALPWLLGATYFNPIDAPYPDFRKVLGGESVTDFVPVNPKLAKDLVAAFTTIGPYPLQIPVRNNCGLVIAMIGQGLEQALGVIIGTRNSTASAEAWAAMRDKACNTSTEV